MSLGLSNTKLSISNMGMLRQSRTKKAAPSIAEKAIFIPKPKKRVEFKLNTRNHYKNIVYKANSEKFTDKRPVSVEKLLTDSFERTQYIGESPDGYVSIEIARQAEKDFSFTPTQEEGRQINHHEIHFSQQYDSYGRPRIGFSREPYDFAATKFIEITSNIQFQENMSKSLEHFKEYMLTGINEVDGGKIDILPLPGEGSKSDGASVVFNAEKQSAGDINFLRDEPNNGNKGKDFIFIDTLGDDTVEPIGKDSISTEATKNSEDRPFDKFFFHATPPKQDETDMYNKDEGTTSTINNMELSAGISIKA